MKPFELYISYVSWGSDGKYRPVLVFDLKDETAYMEYISDGYEVEALHYLIKLVDEKKLFPVLDRAAQRLKRNESAIFMDMGGETARVPLYGIKYIEVR